MTETETLTGQYQVKCYKSNGDLRWQDHINNVVTIEAKNFILDSIFQTVYTPATSYLGLISSVGYAGAPVKEDTLVSHTSWREAGADTNYPTIAARKACVWTTAASGGSKSLASDVKMQIVTTGGTIKGCFIVFGLGAAATLGDTTGKLDSAGLFSSGDKDVEADDYIQISYTTYF
jgi:hypothetical protein